MKSWKVFQIIMNTQPTQSDINYNYFQTFIEEIGMGIKLYCNN